MIIGSYLWGSDMTSGKLYKYMDVYRHAELQLIHLLFTIINKNNYHVKVHRANNTPVHSNS